MDREEALKLLRNQKGRIRWRKWRQTGDPPPDLAGSNLDGVNLCGVNLSKVKLRRAQLSGADLSLADLCGADLCEANLSQANLYGANLQRVRLRRANLYGVDLCRADLRRADLREADLTEAVLRIADLRKANLGHATLRTADLFAADLRDANLRGAGLRSTRLEPRGTARTDFAGACFENTSIECDLSRASGLDSACHVGPSRISVGTILQFKDELPEVFLRGCGLRDEEIAYFRSVVGGVVRFYSCFISYSTKDEEFATRLYNDFQAAGVRCWRWNPDAKTGRSLWGEIDQAIRVHDKVALIASEASLKSPAVNREIERAVCQEDAREKQKQAGQRSGSTDVLFPVTLDGYIFEGWEHPRKADVLSKVIADARGWDADPAVYARVRDKLIKDLKPD